MKIKLIAPHEHRADTISSPFKLQRVNLPLLAALTPPGHTITMVEEAFAPDDIHQEVDLVGISVLTELASRAYRIADAYRRKGVKVVMGGIHPTVLPDEALEHADAVVVGEAEGVWPRLVSDAASGQMQKTYRAGTLRISRACRFRGETFYPGPDIRDIRVSRSASRHPGGVRMTANSVALVRPWGSNIGSGRFTR